SDPGSAGAVELPMAGTHGPAHVRQAGIGKAGEAITAEATEWGADLIILGPSHRGEFATRLLGSATLHVLQHAPCPILVASPAGKADSPRVAVAEHAAAAPRRPVRFRGVRPHYTGRAFQRNRLVPQWAGPRRRQRAVT